MAHYAYDRLSFLDNSFLILEAPNSPMKRAMTVTTSFVPAFMRDLRKNI